MELEFDLAKSEANRLKHDVDFQQAQELWKDLDALQIQAKSDTESGFALIARMEGVERVFYAEQFENPDYFSSQEQTR